MTPRDPADLPSGPRPVPDEAGRLRAFERHAGLEISDHAAFERLTALAARLFDVPWAHITLLGERRQHFRACYGRPFDDGDRETSICTHTILEPPGAVLVLPDAATHPLFRDHLNVVGPPHLRFYAGAPLRDRDGHAIGSLCVIDARPRADLDEAQRATLVDLAALVMHEFERQLATAELWREHRSREELEARLRAVVENTADPVYIKDREGRYVLANAATGDALGRPVREVLGRLDRELFTSEEGERVRAVDEAVMRTRQPVTYELTTHATGARRTYLTTKFPFVLPDGEVSGVVGMGRDITARERAERVLRATNDDLERRVAERTRDLEALAYLDPLTGLGNRRAFDDDLDARLAAPDGEGAAHLLFLDVNDLKARNDRDGHASGDALLRALGAALQGAFAGGRVYRFGGDEFVVVMPGATLSRADLLDRVHAAERRARQDGFPDASVACGTATYPDEAREPNELLRLADRRMLRDKAARHAGRRLAALGDAPREPAGAASGIARRALRSTLALLAGDDDAGDDVWGALTEAAVAAVPGAEAGSLFVREGGAFVLRAQVGFSDALLGLRQSEEASAVWYGDPEGWRTGRARLLVGADIDRRSQAVDVADGRPRNRAVYEDHGDIVHLRASLCAPVLLDGRVVAQLNLDNLRHEDAFAEDARTLAEEFAAQVAALLAARTRRAREAERRRELEGLVAVNAALRGAETPEEAEEVLARQARALLGTDHVALLRHDPAADELRPTVLSGLYREHAEPRLPRGRGLAWAALDAGHVQRVDRAADDPRVHRPDRLPEGALLAAPLLAGTGEPIGVLSVARAGGAFSDLDAQLLGAIAAAGATAIERALGARALVARAREIEGTREGALLALGLALELRDFETAGHTRRVVERSADLGRALGLDADALEGLRQGAYLHDLGKLAVPDDLLLKPGPLTPEEWTTMRAHASIGSELTRHIPTLHPGARDVIRHHHERWDGRGYPDGLAGEKIPLDARVFSVVDAYDALTSARPYKPAWTHAAAAAELRAQSGRQFDPRVVEAFLALWPDGWTQME